MKVYNIGMYISLMWQSLKNIYHMFGAIFATVIYRFPANGMTIIGVTGTDGKTTTASLIYHILINAGKKAALISTIGAEINGKKFETGFHVTTPGSFEIQKYLRRAKNQHVQYVVLEMTSHALDQNRAFGISFAVGVLTNITPEHLDYHKKYDRLVRAKGKLLTQAAIPVINKDDRSYKHVVKLLKHKKIVTYGLHTDANVNPHNFHFTTRLIGRFNRYNCLSAIAACIGLGLTDTQIRSGVSGFKPPVGRQEIVYNSGFMVIVDFAHTPNSFENILTEVRGITKHRLIHVFGSAGKRDTLKRGQMGKISSNFSDIMVITAEDPRSEPVEKITHEIISGITDPSFAILNYKHMKENHIKLAEKRKYVFPISERSEAVMYAISLAQNGDTVLLTGKGHEKSINYGKGEQDWDEFAAVRAGLKSRHILTV